MKKQILKTAMTGIIVIACEANASQENPWDDKESRPQHSKSNDEWEGAISPEQWEEEQAAIQLPRYQQIGALAAIKEKYLKRALADFEQRRQARQANDVPQPMSESDDEDILKASCMGEEMKQHPDMRQEDLIRIHAEKTRKMAEQDTLVFNQVHE
jgi:hypothetical protein